MKPDDYMREAIRLAAEGMHCGNGGPFGCVIVRQGEIVGRGNNCVLATNDPTAHAEITAIREACARLKTFQLADCEVPFFAVEAVEGIGKLFTLATLVLNVLATKRKVEIVFHGINPEDPERKIEAFKQIATSAPKPVKLSFAMADRRQVPGSSSYFRWLTVTVD